MIRESKYASPQEVAFEGKPIEQVEFVVVQDQECRTVYGPCYPLRGASVKARPGQFVVGSYGVLSFKVPTTSGHTLTMALDSLKVACSTEDGMVTLSDPSFKRPPTSSQIAQVDAKLAARCVDVPLRPLIAYFELTGENQLAGAIVTGADASGLDLTAIVDDVHGWYREHYGSKCDALRGFGARPTLIRGTPFLLRLPPVFNARREIPVRPHIEQIQDSLWSILSDDEKQDLQRRFNVAFAEGSDLALLLATLCQKRWPNADLANSYTQRAYAELQATCEGFLSHDGSGIIWNMNQAVEKYLKAFVVLCDPRMDDSRIKKQYGHGIAALIEAAAGFNSCLSLLQPMKGRFLEPPDVRYRPQPMSMAARIEKIDVSYNICHRVAKVILECGEDVRQLVHPAR